VYTLIVFLAACSIPCEPIFVDPRPLSFEECRLRRGNELALYEMVKDIRVWVICQKQEE